MNKSKVRTQKLYLSQQNKCYYIPLSTSQIIFLKRKYDLLESHGKQSKFENVFAMLDTSWKLSDEIFDTLEEFVCALF